jgi:hypothetical protein
MAKIDNRQYTITIIDSDETISFYETGDVFDNDEENMRIKNDIKTKYQGINPLCIINVECDSAI